MPEFLFCCLHSWVIPVLDVGEYVEIGVADNGPSLEASGEPALTVV